MFAFGMRQVWFFVPQKISCSRDFTSALTLYRLHTDGKSLQSDRNMQNLFIP